MNIEETRPHLGRPPILERETNIQDDAYTEEVINILLAMMRYTSSAGLAHGFFLHEDLKYSEEVDQNVTFERPIKPQDESWLRNLIVRMRYGMERKPAEEMERVIKEAYRALEGGSHINDVAEWLFVMLQSNAAEYMFMLLTSRQLRARKANRDRNLMVFLKDIVLNVSNRKQQRRSGIIE